jgi:hypothetical protein
MNDTPESRRWTRGDAWAAWLGSALVMVPAILLTMIMGDAVSSVVGAAAYAVLIAAVAVLAFRHGEHPFALGLTGGYVLLTLISGGECTFWKPISDFGGAGLIYLFVVLIVLGILFLFSAIDMFRNPGR